MSIGGRRAAARRDGPGGCSPSRYVAALGLAVWLLHGSQPWRPPSGAPHFVSCTYGGYLDAWCARLRVASDPRKPDGATISLRIAVLPATKRPAAGALFYLEGGPGGAATASAIRVNASFARVGRTPRSRHGRPARHGRLEPSCLPRLVRPRSGCEGRDRLSAAVFRPARRRSTPVYDEPGRTRPGDGAAPARVSEDRSLRGLVRRDARAGVRAPIPGVRAHRRPRQRVAPGRPDLRPLRP